MRVAARLIKKIVPVHSAIDLFATTITTTIFYILIYKKKNKSRLTHRLIYHRSTTGRIGLTFGKQVAIMTQASAKSNFFEIFLRVHAFWALVWTFWLPRKYLISFNVMLILIITDCAIRNIM